MPNELRVVLIGAGGVGTRLAKDITRTLEYQREFSALVIIDGDCYEPDNLKRQEFAAVGNKAEVLAAELSEKFVNTFIIPEAGWVVAKDDNPPEIKDDESEEVPEGQTNKKIVASELLAEDDIVFVTVDNFAARAAVFDAARNFTNIDVLTGGNDEALYGSTYHYRRRDGMEVTEHPAVRQDEYVNPPDKNPGDLNCQERAELEGGEQTIAANAAVAAFLMGRLHVLLADKDPVPAAEIFFDLELGMASASPRPGDAAAQVAVEENVTTNHKVLEGV